MTHVDTSPMNDLYNLGFHLSRAQRFLYTDRHFLELERLKLFRRSWMLAGLSEQIPNPGDVVPVTVGGMPLLLVRSESGEVGVFHNVCLHRGAVLVTKARNCQRLVCPYHAWTYALNGRLRSRAHLRGPGEHEQQPPVDLGLTPVRFEIWQGLVFVNIEGIAEPFADYIAPATRVMDGRDMSHKRLAGTLRFELKANWKLVHENFFDMWHTFHIHPTLASLSPFEMGKHRRTQVDGNCIWAEHTIAAPQEGRGKGVPPFERFPASKGRFFQLFPSTNIHIWPESVTVFQGGPRVLGEPTSKSISFFLLTLWARLMRRAAKKVFAQWDALNLEDIKPLELMQEGRHSVGFDGGVLTQYWDGPLQTFALRVAEAVRS